MSDHPKEHIIDSPVHGRFKVIHPDPEPIKFPTLPPGAEGPPCIWCNAPTKRTGACFTCIACGATTSC